MRINTAKYRTNRLNRRIEVFNAELIRTNIIKQGAGEGLILSGVSKIMGPVGLGLMAVQIAGFIGNEVAKGMYSALDDVSYFSRDLEQYIQEYGKVGSLDPTYQQHKETMDTVLAQSKQFPSLYTEIEAMPEQLKKIGELGKAGDTSVKEKLEAIAKKVSDHNKFCSDFMQGARNITALVKAGRSTGGAIWDAANSFLGIDWAPWTTFSTQFERTSQDLSTKLEPHFALMDELDRGIRKALDGYDASPSEKEEAKPSSEVKPVVKPEQQRPDAGAFGVAGNFLDHLSTKV